MAPLRLSALAIFATLLPLALAAPVAQADGTVLPAAVPAPEVLDANGIPVEPTPSSTAPAEPSDTGVAEVLDTPESNSILDTLGEGVLNNPITAGPGALQLMDSLVRCKPGTSGRTCVSTNSK